MAYEVTATRRRPQHFEDLAGQEFVAETLKNSIKTGQIAHAYLFAGPRGCGKTSSARILAKALNCQHSEGPTSEPCGECESCKAITNSSSLDVIEIDGASNTSVNDVRQIKDEVMFPPATCRYKIYIIDEVHMLSTSAFNALLKTIEEPPAHVIFIFATTELQKVPATIKSRCQQYNFRLVSIEKLKTLLSDACAEMNIQADDEALYWIAKESGGSVRDCYTLFDQVAAFSQGHITYDKIRDKLGILGVDRLNAIFECCVDENPSETMNQLDSFLQSGISIEQLISNSTDYLRSLLLIKNGITKESLLGQSPERYSQKVLSSWNTIQTEQAVSIFLQLYRDIRYSISPRYELELAFSRLCWLKQYVSPAEVKAAIDKAQHLLMGSAAPVAPVAASSTAQASTYAQGGSFAPAASASATPASASASAPSPAAAPSAAPASSPVAQQAVQPQSQENYNASPETFASQDSFNATPPNIPTGMPTFSALRDNKEEPNPFYNGGAVPPKNTAATIPEQDIDSYEEWADTAAPEDDYSPEEQMEIQEEFAQNYVETDDNSALPSDVHKTDATLTTQDGKTISIENLYGKTISDLSVSNPLVSSALMQTGAWTANGNTISTTINSEYQKRQIESAKEQISSIFSSICGEKIDFEINLIEESKKNNEPVSIPNQVKILCSAFKGNIVGGKL